MIACTWCGAAHTDKNPIKVWHFAVFDPAPRLVFVFAECFRCLSIQDHFVKTVKHQKENK